MIKVLEMILCKYRGCSWALVLDDLAGFSGHSTCGEVTLPVFLLAEIVLCIHKTSLILYMLWYSSPLFVVIGRAYCYFGSTKSEGLEVHPTFTTSWRINLNTWVNFTGCICFLVSFFFLGVWCEWKSSLNRKQLFCNMSKHIHDSYK